MSSRLSIRWMGVVLLLGAASSASVVWPTKTADTKTVVPLTQGGGGTNLSGGSSSAAVGGNGNGNNGSGNGNGGGNGDSSHPITVTGIVVGQPAPGRTARLDVTIDNAKNAAILVKTVTAAVTSVTTGAQLGKPACKASWYSISSFSGSLRVEQGAKSVVPLTVTFANDPLVNQDNCKGATFSYSFSASAQQA